MLNIIYRLYDALGIEIDADEPALMVDNELTVYFTESQNTLEMCCPIGPLPTNTPQLYKLLQMNYTSPVVLAADAENTLLLGLLRFPETSSGIEIESGLHQLIDISRHLRNEIYSQV